MTFIVLIGVGTGVLGLLSGLFLESRWRGVLLSSVPGLLFVILAVAYFYFGDLSHDAQAAVGPVLAIIFGGVVCVIGFVGWGIGRVLRPY